MAPNGAILAVLDEGLFRLDLQSKQMLPVIETTDLDNLSLRFIKGDKAQVTVRQPRGGGYHQNGTLKGVAMGYCVLWSVNLKDWSKEKTKNFWNVYQMQVGEAGGYGLTPAGKLKRLQGASFRSVSGRTSYERILARCRTPVPTRVSD